MDQDKIRKQNFLRTEIIEKNYDPDVFSDWMEKQREDGNLDSFGAQSYSYKAAILINGV